MTFQLVSKRHAKLERTLKEYRALCILGKTLAKDDRVRLEAQIESVRSLPMREVVRGLEFYEEAVNEMSIRLGRIATLDEIRRQVEEGQTTPPFILYAPKHVIESEWFTNFSHGRFGSWEHLPPHARIGIDLAASREDHNSRFEWRLLEASLFEDMGLLWNEVLSMEAPEPTTVPLGDERMRWKRSDVLKRSLVRAGFALLEGYLNGLALDIRLTRNDLTPKETERLTEVRDGTRFAPMSLRDKVLSYPRIAMRSEYPLFTEQSFKELEVVLLAERRLRDSLMHPTPKLEENRSEQREQSFYTVTREESHEVVDALCAVIRRIDTELGGMFGDTSAWLFNRDASDRYPNEVFY